MALQTPQRSFPSQVLDRLNPQHPNFDPWAAPGLVARHLLRDDPDKTRAARRQQEQAAFLKNLSDQDERFKKSLEDLAVRIVPTQASLMTGIAGRAADQEAGRTMAIDDSRTGNVISTMRAGGEVKGGLIGKMGEAAERLQGVANQGQVGVTQAQGTNRVNEIGALTTGAVTVGDAAARNDLTRIKAQLPILESVQGQEQEMFDRAANLGRYAIDGQRVMQRDILAHQAAMNRRPPGLAGFIERLYPLIPAGLAIAALRG